MKRAARALLAAAVMLLAGIIAYAAPAGEELLRRSEQAERAHDYRGLRVIRMVLPQCTVTAEAAVIHRRPATTRIEYLSPPSVAGTVVLQVGPDRWRRSPRNNHWHRAAPAPEAHLLDLLVRNYDLRAVPGSPVARRDCVLLIINPKHEGNPSKRIWIDQATGLVMRSEVLNWKQDDISISAFKSIEIDPDLSSDGAQLTPPPKPPPHAPPDPGFKAVYPRYVPPGYVFVSTDTMLMGKHRAAHLRYSDGLNSISVFQVPAQAFGGQQPFAGPEWRFTQVITWRRGDMDYAVVGDIDPAELRNIADSMGPAAPARSR